MYYRSEEEALTNKSIGVRCQLSRISGPNTPMDESSANKPIDQKSAKSIYPLKFQKMEKRKSMLSKLYRNQINRMKSSGKKILMN